MEKGKIVYDQEPETLVPDLPYIVGKMYRSKINGNIIKGCGYLGKIYFLNNEWLDEPIVETVDDYELIDIIENSEES